MSNPFKAPTPPPIPTLVISPDGNGYGLAGWDELDRWANLNVGVWRATKQHQQAYGITEADRLRFLAATLLTENLRLADELMRAKAQLPIGMFK